MVILFLRRPDHPNINKLEGLITSQTSCSLYVIFKYMEHDLYGIVTLLGGKFTEPQMTVCWMQTFGVGMRLLCVESRSLHIPFQITHKGRRLFSNSIREVQCRYSKQGATRHTG